MEVSATTRSGGETDADTIVVGVLDGQLASADAPSEVADLLSTGEARGAFKSLALAHAGGKRWLTVGLGTGDDLTPERARVAAAVACDRARELSATRLCWQLPTDAGADIAAAVVEGTVLANYRFDRHKSKPPDGPDAPPRELAALIIAAAAELG